VDKTIPELGDEDPPAGAVEDEGEPAMAGERAGG
jgi:hypothetical protein